MRSHEEIFALLAAPFPENEVRERPKGGKMLKYITARMARRRLNEVLGPFKWNVEVEPTENWVLCTITVTLDDGHVVVRTAMGGYPDMPDHEDRVKGGDSDGFKRACALYGIGEYLYDDPDHSQVTGHSGGQRQQAQPGRGFQQPPKGAAPRQEHKSLPTNGSGLYSYVCRLEEQKGWPQKTLVKQIDDSFGPGSSYNHPRSWKEWSAEQVAVVVNWIQSNETDGQQEEDRPPY